MLDMWCLIHKIDRWKITSRSQKETTHIVRSFPTKIRYDTFQVESKVQISILKPSALNFWSRCDDLIYWRNYKNLFNHIHLSMLINCWRHALSYTEKIGHEIMSLLWYLWKNLMHATQKKTDITESVKPLPRNDHFYTIDCFYNYKSFSRLIVT